MKDNVRKWLRITEHEDERVQALEYRSYAEAGFLVAVICFLDMVIRGVFLDRPLSEWAFSAAVFVVFILYVYIRNTSFRIRDEDLLEPDELKEKRHDEVTFFIAFALYVGWRKVYRDMEVLPSGWVDWAQSLLALIVIYTVIYGFLYLAKRAARLFKKSSGNS
ncbi:hypothetical protein DNH61_10225 [Paenibacillus sambharensis]|uniref:Uncharacterized protein n=1 Tax=Paenibacillus sambharensis TaxID=1803190 RepID=A0A2W1LCM9_9BACL|nr:DUF6773 family protein [Paenibacillus sambharensis]PZD95820.1 hypothetical protein DNH61_10225 [Paenibacillus sambharensis]